VWQLQTRRQITWRGAGELQDALAKLREALK
jgi:hypothetical protein